MNAFNLGSKANIYVDTNDDGVTVRFGSDTLGFNTTSTGFSVTNDWNNRHFTLGFDENSILYHVTREDIDDRRSGNGNLPPEEFVAEIYGYIRSLAPPVPVDQIPFEIVGKVKMDAVREYLFDRGVIRDTSAGLRVNGQKRVELVEKWNSDLSERGKFYQQVLEPVKFEDAKKDNSGENIYAYPKVDRVYVLFFFPDKYVGVTTLQDLVGFASIAGGSQIFDHLLRSISDQ
ncbi:hypothetical protein [Haloferax chudinovii]|uniref:Uncharacterized protein n=1 Tax=Haloferax chudinovii TaxID=1109010 RepID=A0ABD5XL43_9EURY